MDESTKKITGFALAGVAGLFMISAAVCVMALVSRIENRFISFKPVFPEASTEILILGFVGMLLATFAVHVFTRKVMGIISLGAQSPPP